MDFQHLFLSTDGRLNRQPFWIGIAILFVINIIIAFGLLGLIFAAGSTIGGIISLLISIVFMIPAYCLMKKRLQDRDSDGKILLPYFGLIILSNLVNLFVGPTNFEDPAAAAAVVTSPFFLVSSALSLVALIISLYLLVVCGFLRGTEGPNQYGPDPLP